MTELPALKVYKYKMKYKGENFTAHQAPSEKGSTLGEKNLLTRGKNSSF